MESIKESQLVHFSHHSNDTESQSTQIKTIFSTFYRISVKNSFLYIFFQYISYSFRYKLHSLIRDL